MNIQELKEKLDKAGIKYEFYDCYAGSNDRDYPIFNTQVLIPLPIRMEDNSFEKTLQNAIYSSDKSNWNIFNASEFFIKSSVQELQNSQFKKEQDKFYPDTNNQEFKIHKVKNAEEQFLLAHINLNLSDLLLENGITNKSAFGKDLREIHNESTFKIAIFEEIEAVLREPLQSKEIADFIEFKGSFEEKYRSGYSNYVFLDKETKETIEVLAKDDEVFLDEIREDILEKLTNHIANKLQSEESKESQHKRRHK